MLQLRPTAAKQMHKKKKDKIAILQSSVHHFTQLGPDIAPNSIHILLWFFALEFGQFFTNLRFLFSEQILDLGSSIQQVLRIHS